MNDHYYTVQLKSDVFDAICMTHGWGRGKLAQLARELGYTRQFISICMQGKGGFGGDAIGKIVRDLCGIHDDNWSHLFDIVEVKKKSFQKNNQLKYNGIVPYDKYSLAQFQRYGKWNTDENNIDIENDRR